MSQLKVKKSDTKIAGVYLVRVNGTGKIYIGESSDIYKRWKRYIWAVNSDRDYAETKRAVVKDMRKYGLQMCDFVILEYGEEHKDLEYRVSRENYFIEKYNSSDPKIGYNGTKGGETGPRSPRPQGVKERLKRAKPIILYDIKKDKGTLYFGGAKSIGEDFGHDKAVMSHIVKRGSIFKDRYFLIPFSIVEQNDILARFDKKIEDAEKYGGGALTKVENSLKEYKKALNRVNEIFEIS